MYTKVNTSSTKLYLIIALFVAFSMLLAACAAPTQSVIAPAPTTSAATQAPLTLAKTQPAPISSEAEIKVATDPTLGDILVDGKGMTLYMFTKDAPDKSNCTGNCLVSWPPLVTQGKPTLDSGVDSSLTGSTALADGRKIVTYNHMPLYYFAKDTKPGDTLGQGVGTVWYVVSAMGEPVKSSSATSPTSAPVAGASAPTIAVASNATLGQILVDGKGMTLYMFKIDKPGVSNCDAKCLKSWPPFVTQGTPTLGTGVDQSMLGTATTTDGRTIVTYNHMPLYYFFKDTKAGDTLGQGVGSVWYVVAPDGTVITK